MIHLGRCKGMFQCPLCWDRFSEKSDLRRHVSRVHPAASLEVLVGVGWTTPKHTPPQWAQDLQPVPGPSHREVTTGEFEVSSNAGEAFSPRAPEWEVGSDDDREAPAGTEAPIDTDSPLGAELQLEIDTEN